MGESRPPPFVICHLCGRKYGTKSIRIHVPQCQQKWDAENRKLPKQLRRSMPMQPDYSILQSGNFSSDVVERMNERAFELSQSQLIPCENCGRTFYPEKLPVHQRSCTAENPSRPPPSTHKQNTHTNDRNSGMHIPQVHSGKQTDKTKGKSSEAIVYKDHDDSTMLCSICMEQIPKERIEIHLVCCNQEKVKQILSGNHSKVTKGSRPRTRTLHRGPPSLDVDGTDGTYVVVKPNNSSEQKESVVIAKSDFVQCDSCNRKFIKARIGQHKAVCSKMKARKTFDSSKQRMAGLDLNNITKNNRIKWSKTEGTKDKSNWRLKHQDLIQSIRAAKQVAAHMSQGGKASDLPPPPPSLNLDYVHCKYCDRRFNPEVAERHIPRCATIKNRPAPPKKKALDVFNNNEVSNNSNSNNNNNCSSSSNNNNNKVIPVKKSSTFNVGRSSNKFQELVKDNRPSEQIDLSATYNLQGGRHGKKKKENKTFCGYISPTVGKTRYDSFDVTHAKNDSFDVTHAKNGRPSSSRANHRNSDNSNAPKERSTMKRTSSQKLNSGYSYNAVRKAKNQTQPQQQLKDFIF